jgi:hypothetical protein
MGNGRGERAICSREWHTAPPYVQLPQQEVTELLELVANGQNSSRRRCELVLRRHLQSSLLVHLQSKNARAPPNAGHNSLGQSYCCGSRAQGGAASHSREQNALSPLQFPFPECGTEKSVKNKRSRWRVLHNPISAVTKGPVACLLLHTELYTDRRHGPDTGKSLAAGRRPAVH